MLTRRRMLSLGAKVALGTSATLALRRFPLARAKETPPGASMAPPRYVVKLFLAGGLDSIYTFDPKEKHEVASGVDVPYPAEDITLAGNLKLGPHFASLAKWHSHFTVLKGVDCSTANHNTGQAQAVRLRTKTTAAMPSIFEILGAHRDSQPLGAVTLGARMMEAHTPGWFGQPGSLFGQDENRLLHQVDTTPPEDLRTLAKVLKQKAKRLTGQAHRHEALTTGQNLGDAAAFFDRVADVPKFQSDDWGMKDVFEGPDMTLRMQRALWLLEHDLSSTVFVSVIGGAVTWDTHTDNARRQTHMNTKFAPMLDRFLSELEGRSNAHGRLIDQTLVIVASELGRFPYLNTAGGKDHFPEAPFLFVGPWFGGDRDLGRTGKQMAAASLDVRTGRPKSSGGHHIMVDDVGATLLRLWGLEPELYGYSGKVLEFLLQG